MNTEAVAEVTATPRLTVSGVTKSFGMTKALSGIDMTIDARTVLAVIGENGAGKSTLMKILAGIHQADAGSMQLAGAPYAPQHAQQAKAAGVVMVH